MAYTTPAAGDRAERMAGVFLVLGGIGIAYLLVYRPYVAMLSGELDVRVRMLGAMIGPICICIGVTQLLLGAKAPVLLGRSAFPSWKTYLLLLLFIGLAYGVYYWLKLQAQALGYAA
jgi:hypothetical protein